MMIIMADHESKHDVEADRKTTTTVMMKMILIIMIISMQLYETLLLSTVTKAVEERQLENDTKI